MTCEVESWGGNEAVGSKTMKDVCSEAARLKAGYSDSRRCQWKSSVGWQKSVIVFQAAGKKTMNM